MARRPALVQDPPKLNVNQELKKLERELEVKLAEVYTGGAIKSESRRNCLIKQKRIGQNIYKQFLVRLDSMENFVAPCHMNAVYAFLLSHAHIIPIDDVLSFLNHFKSTLAERIRVIHLKARIIKITDETKENFDGTIKVEEEDEEEYELIEVNDSVRYKTYHIMAKHPDMAISWN